MRIFPLYWAVLAVKCVVIGPGEVHTIVDWFQVIFLIPVPDPSVRPEERHTLGGEIPSPLSPPSGCRFRTRCPRADQQCTDEVPVMAAVGDDHYVACHHPVAPGESITEVALTGASA